MPNARIPHSSMCGVKILFGTVRSQFAALHQPQHKQQSQNTIEPDRIRGRVFS